MKIEEYELGQKVSLYGIIEEINIEDIYDKENTTILSIKTVTGKISVNPKWEKVTTDIDQPKPVVPKFVAEWIEKYKEKGRRLSHALEQVFDDVELSLYIKQQEGDYTEIIAKAWIYGYEVEKEKLYTVEIPNPNTPAITVLARSIVGDVVMCNKLETCWKNNSRYQLTEQEIRKDFDWAWERGFAKEVTE